MSEQNAITIDLDTGKWLSEGSISDEQGARVAASVLPGVTPEQVSRWYSAKVRESDRNAAGLIGRARTIRATTIDQWPSHAKALIDELADALEAKVAG